MLESTTKSLSVSQRKKPSSVKESAVIVLDFIRKIEKPSRSQIIEKLQEHLGFSEIEAHQTLRRLEDNGEIFTLEDSFLKVVLHRDLTTYEIERSKSQQRWIEAKEQGGCFS